MKQFEECSTKETDTEIHRDEESVEIFFRHEKYPLECEIIEIDNCVFKKVENLQTCDFLFLFDLKKQEYNFLKNSKAYYVELKSTDLAKAYNQLFNSIENTSEQILGFEINAILVSNREFVPEYHNTDRYRELKRLIRKNVQIESNPCTIKL